MNEAVAAARGETTEDTQSPVETQVIIEEIGNESVGTTQDLKRVEAQIDDAVSNNELSPKDAKALKRAKRQQLRDAKKKAKLAKAEERRAKRDEKRRLAQEALPKRDLAAEEMEQDVAIQDEQAKEETEANLDSEAPDPTAFEAGESGEEQVRCTR
eukprot:GHVU01045255.1.p1 GENE.GHVU01045255.1~~GHVU01045255.1.p1  ORF type:complete len:156 (-),score=41.76 GHVU01045255.1:508-975(-)